MEKDFGVKIFFKNIFTTKKPGVADFVEITETSIILIKKTFANSVTKRIKFSFVLSLQYNKNSSLW